MTDDDEIADETEREIIGAGLGVPEDAAPTAESKIKSDPDAADLTSMDAEGDDGQVFGG